LGGLRVNNDHKKASDDTAAAEVTPEMIKVGVEFFESATEDRFPSRWAFTESFVADLYRVMHAAMGSSLEARLGRRIAEEGSPQDP
jgi:hypothetical protein